MPAVVVMSPMPAAPICWGTAGRYAPLITDEVGGSEVIYDKAIDVYLAVFGNGKGLVVRASN